MTNLGKPLREALANEFELRWPDVRRAPALVRRNRKYLFRLDGGATIESVYIPEETRRTICISTQAGCPLKCAFCLTGIAGYQRNLKPWRDPGPGGDGDGQGPGRSPASRADRPGTSWSWAWASRCSTTTQRVGACAC